jgi:hypothetical protein
MKDRNRGTITKRKWGCVAASSFDIPFVPTGLPPAVYHVKICVPATFMPRCVVYDVCMVASSTGAVCESLRHQHQEYMD